MKKISAAINAIGEWAILSLVILFTCYLLFIQIVNVLFVDMSWEVPEMIATSVSSLVLAVVFVGIITGLCIYFFTSTNQHDDDKKLKRVLWFLLLGSHIFVNPLYMRFSLNYEWSLIRLDFTFYLTIMCASIYLVILLIIQSWRETKNKKARRPFEHDHE